jgi:hypothetical protein
MTHQDTRSQMKFLLPLLAATLAPLHAAPWFDGADLSALNRIEELGGTFSDDNGHSTNAHATLASAGANCVRLRLFVAPDGRGFTHNDLPRTLESQLPGYRQAGGAKIEVEGGGKAPAAGKLEDVSAQPIPDKPAAGKVHGREFKVEKATLEEGCLKLRQGEGFSSHLEEFEIDLSRKKVENFAGQTFTVELNQKAGIDITLAYSGERKGSIKTRTYMENYTMKLDFGTAKDGKLPGKIHLRLPDEAGSFVVGTFEAEIK